MVMLTGWTRRLRSIVIVIVTAGSGSMVMIAMTVTAVFVITVIVITVNMPGVNMTNRSGRAAGPAVAMMMKVWMTSPNSHRHQRIAGYKQARQWSAKGLHSSARHRHNTGNLNPIILATRFGQVHCVLCRGLPHACSASQTIQLPRQNGTVPLGLIFRVTWHVVSFRPTRNLAGG